MDKIVLGKFYKLLILRYFMQLKEAIESRKSVKRFSTKKPDWKKIIRAIDYVRFAPSAGNKFVTKFILVDDEKKITKLCEASQQDFVGTAQYIIVAVSDDKKLLLDYGERGERYCAQQAGAAIQNLLLALTEQKLETTWVGHFFEDKIKATLSIPDDFHVEAIFPIGLGTKIRSGERREISLDHILYFNKWGNDQMTPSQKFSQDAI